MLLIGIILEGLLSLPGILSIVGTIITLYEKKRHKDEDLRKKINMSIIIIFVYSILVGGGIGLTSCTCGIPMIGKPAVFFAYISVVVDWIYNFICIRKEKINLTFLSLLCFLEIMIIVFLTLTLSTVFPFEHDNVKA